MILNYQDRCHTPNKPIALIIDEVQDYYWLQLKAVYALLRKQDASSLLILLGDENQRVTISGFTWTALANSFNQTYNVRLPGILQLTRNFRNTKAIARVAGFFLEQAFPIGQVVAGGKHPQKLPDPETCFEEGLPPRIIEFDTNWLSEFICRLKSTRTSGTSSRFVLIIHEASEHYSRFKQEFSPDSEQVVVLNVQQAKGQEFDAVILVSPFLLKKEHLSLDDLFEWYTSITRARRYEAILVSPEEMQWLRTNVNQPEQLETLFALCSNLKLEEFTKEVLLEGKSFLTAQQLQKLFISQVAASIADWVMADQPLPEVTIGCQRYNLNWWNICEEIETEVWELLSHQKLAPDRLQAVLDALRAERLLQDLPVLYFGTKRLLAQAQVNLKPIAAQVVQRLEQWFRASPQDVIPALSQVKNLELRVMLLRVVGHSWQAADLLRSHSAEDWIEEVALDLERRELPYEAARLRVQYLGQQYPPDYPLVKVLSQTEPLAVALCSYFTKIMETLA